MNTEPGQNGPAHSPYESFEPDTFTRADESSDNEFYMRDRLVSHLDWRALTTVEEIIGKLIVEESPAILDLMASWDSHLPATVRPSMVTGLGLNRNELLHNNALSERVIHDLNAVPRLPFEDAAFDVVLNSLSVDYLVKPFEIFREVGRILKKGGLFLVVFSNRMFPQKAVKVWTQSSETERVGLVRRFFLDSGLFEQPEVFASRGKPRPADDKYAYLGIPSDPVYAVYAERVGAAGQSGRPKLAEPLTRGFSTAARQGGDRDRTDL